MAIALISRGNVAATAALAKTAAECGNVSLRALTVAVAANGNANANAWIHRSQGQIRHAHLNTANSASRNSIYRDEKNIGNAIGIRRSFNSSTSHHRRRGYRKHQPEYRLKDTIDPPASDEANTRPFDQRRKTAAAADDDGSIQNYAIRKHRTEKGSSLTAPSDQPLSFRRVQPMDQEKRRFRKIRSDVPVNRYTKTEPPSPPLAIVFTDIVKSTAIWESHPKSMKTALKLHDEIVRDLTATHGGYEVKQNGDGFMLAFPSAVSAVQFCLDVQVRLLEVKWPSELLEVGAGMVVTEPEGDVGKKEKEEIGISNGDETKGTDENSIPESSGGDGNFEQGSKPGKIIDKNDADNDNTSANTKATEDVNSSEAGNEEEEEGKVLFKGLRLRMSAHFGSPIQSHNSVIDRMDYFGPMVNRAARFIQATEGGQIVVSEEFLEELRKAKVDSQDDSVKSDTVTKNEKTVENGVRQTSDNAVGEGPLFSSSIRSFSKDSEEKRINEKTEEEGETVDFDLQNLQSENTQSQPKDRQFEIRLLGKRHFKGLSGKQKLYFIVPHSLKGRLKYWPRHKHVPGSKGNLVD